MRKLKQMILPMMLLLATQQVFGQIPAIDSFTVIPENPVAGDEVKVIVYATFPYGDCDLTNHAIDVQNGIIVLDLVYTIGAATYICHSTDTVTIGYLEKGKHPLEINLYVETGLTGEQTLEDSESTIIPVDQPLSIHVPPGDSGISMYPNPFYEEISISTDVKIDRVEILSVTGEKLVVYVGDISDTSINLSDLNPGIYFLRVAYKNGDYYSQKISKRVH